MHIDTLINFIAFIMLTLLWLAFGAALMARRGLLDQTWRRFRDLPTWLQLLVALLILPIVVGLWIWQRSWPVWLRLALVAGLAWTTLYTFFPRTLFA